MRRVLTVVAVLLGWGSVPTSAEELSLDRAMARARLEAHEVLAAQARARASGERIEQVKSYRLPKLAVQEVWLRTNSPADVFALQLQQERFDFGDFMQTDPNSPEPLTNSLMRFELTMPLYTGSELSSRIDQARLAAEADEIKAIWAEETAALAAAEAYIRLAQAREAIVLLEHSLETVDAHVALAGAYVEEGMLVRSELLRAELEQAKILDLLSEARGMERVAAAGLAFRMGADPSLSWDLETLVTPRPMSEGLDGWLGTASNRRDLMAAQRLLRAGELEVDVKRSGFKPKLGVVARHDLNDDRLFGANGQSSTVMLVGSIDVLSWGRHGRAAAAAEAEWEAGRTEIEMFEEAIGLEVREAYERAVSARERHLTAASAQESATEVERITEARFEQGVVKMLDLLDATTARLEADNRELMARTEAHLADLMLALRSGRSPETALAMPAGN
jgi:outer membrane protein TolC